MAAWPTERDQPARPRRPPRLFGSAPPIEGLILGGPIPFLPWGCLFLLAGDPGVGKSTVALQVAAAWADAHGAACYWAFEESHGLVRARAELIGAARRRIYLLSDSHDLSLTGRPVLHVVDTIQVAPALDGSRLYTAAHVARVVELWRGRVRSVRRAAALLLSHVDKEGVAAGPNAVAHAVDVVAYLRRADPSDDRSPRVLQLTKNRYGPCGDRVVPWPWKEETPA